MKLKSIIISAVAAVAIVGGGTATALASTGDNAGHKPAAPIELTPAGKGTAPDFGSVKPGQAKPVAGQVLVEHPTTGDAPDDGTIQLPPADVVEGHATPLDATPVIEDQTGTGDGQVDLEAVNPK